MLPRAAYHGTSSYFARKIAAKGLGTENYLKKIGMFEFLEHAAPLIQDCMIRQGRENEIPVLEYFKNQIVTRGGGNFRHGSTYLSLSKSRAVSYSAHNQYGSELISKIFGELISCEIDVNELIRNMAPDLMEIFHYNHKPMIIKIDKIPLSFIKTEKGEDVFEELALFEKINNSPGGEEMMQIFNFELIKGLNPGELEFFEITDYEPSDYLVNKFTLKEIPIIELI